MINEIKWSAYEKIEGSDKPNFLKPLEWRGGDQFSDVIKMVDFFYKNQISDKTNVLIYKSAPGGGKSLSILNVAKEIGKTIIVVPFKALQRQYFEDYFKGNKFVTKKDGSKLNVAVFLGRNNFPCQWLKQQYDFQQKLVEESKKPENAGHIIDVNDTIISMYRQDSSCANKHLPCVRPLKLTKGRGEPRWVAASKCPFWVPTPVSKTVIDSWQETIEKEIDDVDEEEKTRLDTIKERVKCSTIKYYQSVGMGEVGIFFRDEVDKNGNKCPIICPYYKQFYNYIDSDVIVMNGAKWKLETRMGRKPFVSLEVMDEGDYWLDSQSKEVDIQRSTIDKTIFIDENMRKMKSQTIAAFDMYFRLLKNDVDNEYKSSGINIIGAEKYKALFSMILNFLNGYKKFNEDNDNLEESIFDLEMVLRHIDKGSISYIEGKREESKIIKIFIPFPDSILKEIFEKSSKNIILASGTMHSNSVLDNLFGINNNNYTIEFIEGRKINPGKLKCIKPYTGLIKVNHTSWQSPQFREYYYKILNYILDQLKIYIDKATGKPGMAKIIVLTPSKKYVKEILNRSDVFADFAKDNLDEGDTKVTIHTSLSDFVDNKLTDIRKIKNDDIQLDGDVYRTNQQIIISTRLIRGADLRDDKCRGVVITKWPIPDVSAGYNQALKKRFGDDKFWEIMHDKAQRESIQYVSRGLRHDYDWTYFSTPDSMTFDNVYRLFTYD